MSVILTPRPTVSVDDLVTSALDRLGDLDEAIWSRAEMTLYTQDGYDLYARRTRCIFDRWTIENLPPAANWQTDWERYLALQKSGWGVTDEPFHITAESERGMGVAGQVGKTYKGPSGLTSPTDRQYVSTQADGDIPTAMPGGTLPDTTVEITRVTYDDRELTGFTSQQMRQLDPLFETRSGDPQMFVFDGDGINFLRVVPAATGSAVYDTVDGSWGTLTYTDDTAVTPVTTEPSGYNTGGYGILVCCPSYFPMGAPWGTPTRFHPATDNVVIDMHRTGRPDYPVEVPLAYQKYIIYWAMHRALSREGPGQDDALAEHYSQRFDMGVSHMRHKVDQYSNEQVRRFRAPNAASQFGIGDPSLPSNYPSAF